MPSEVLKRNENDIIINNNPYIDLNNISGNEDDCFIIIKQTDDISLSGYSDVEVTECKILVSKCKLIND